MFTIYKIQTTALYYCIVLVFLSISNSSRLVSALRLISYDEANERVGKELKHDRPCNFLLDIDDAHLSTPGIIEKYGYPVERHWVTTEDHYILELHRIPRGPDKNGKPSPAVYLMHGVMSSSRDFVINCDKRALAFQLYDNGYDVWMGNYRGNRYSRNHTVLDPDNIKFWDFSIDEIGFYDVPANIDYILETTKVKQVTYIGHSMGNGIILVMLSTRPEYNEKINFWFALSAAINIQGTSSPVLRILATFYRIFQWMLGRYNSGRLFPTIILKVLNQNGPYWCQEEGKTGDYHGLCARSLFVNDGYHPGQIPPEFWSVVIGEIPTTTSVKFLVQWMQWIVSGNFAMYDEGPLKNLAKYGDVTPKLYNIQNVNTSTILFWGENDWIVDASDIRRMEALVTRLRPKDPPVEFFKVESPLWNHIDFIYGKDADIYVYSHILRKLGEIYPNKSQNDSLVTGQNVETELTRKYKPSSPSSLIN